MKKKAYNVLKWIPIVNCFLPRPAVSIYGSLAIESGMRDEVSDYISRHPELRNQVLTEKMVGQILEKIATAKK